ncbi:hypothetical protein B0H13DRAFT_1085643 [Mycena leptocephala]|nr:hypothetical protein B0H13DRAFT_1085643 [Mycena leptocephala]
MKWVVVVNPAALPREHLREHIARSPLSLPAIITILVPPTPTPTRTRTHPLAPAFARSNFSFRSPDGVGWDPHARSLAAGWRRPRPRPSSPTHTRTHPHAAAHNAAFARSNFSFRSPPRWGGVDVHAGGEAYVKTVITPYPSLSLHPHAPTPIPTQPPAARSKVSFLHDGVKWGAHARYGGLARCGEA